MKSIVGTDISVVSNIQKEKLCARPKLLAIGSVIQFACVNDVIWGSGVKTPLKFPKKLTAEVMHTLDIRAVRGPRTRQFLISKFGLNVPKIYGDPALLLPYYLTSYRKVSPPTIETLLILHYIDSNRSSELVGSRKIIATDTTAPWYKTIRLIIRSAFVISTSLHGVIVAEAFGVPARLLKSPHLDLFKFHDYFEGTGRSLTYASTIDEAMQLGGERAPNISLQKLLDVFPFERFSIKPAAKLLWCVLFLFRINSF